MEKKLGRIRKTQHLIKLLEWREHRCEASKVLKSKAQFCHYLIYRLGLEAELEGHKGCVNCLEWSPNGLHLASGSDDTNVILWDPFRHKQLQVIPTPHVGNIFSVKFIGDENVIATAAGDYRVVVQSVQGAVDKAVPLLDCACHNGRVKRLATAPDQPNLFWSAGEEGLVLQFDMREPHECPTQSKALIDLTYRSELKCIAVNPTRSHLLAVGANDCFVRLYDRRMIKPTTLASKVNRSLGQGKRTPPPLIGNECVQYYAAGHLAKENAGIISLKLAVTYIAFNKAGTEMLANVGGEQIYLFDINKPRHINELRIPQSLPKRQESSYKNCCHNGQTNGLTTNEKHANNAECACFFMKRALKALRRNWVSDIYGAARDYLHVIQHWPDNQQAYIGLIKCLIALKWDEEAEVWYKYLTRQFPYSETSAQMKTLSDNLSALKNPQNNQNEEQGIKKVEDVERDIRLNSYDYEKRFLGHCNTTTDIKEANFLGEDGNYICAGSDEGIIFLWEKESMEIVRALNGDNSIVNCIQPHPSACKIASSGIDSEVKLWSPLPKNKENTKVVRQISTVVEENQKRMCLDPFESMLATIGYPIAGNSLEAHSFGEVATCRTS